MGSVHVELIGRNEIVGRVSPAVDKSRLWETEMDVAHALVVGWGFLDDPRPVAVRDCFEEPDGVLGQGAELPLPGVLQHSCFWRLMKVATPVCDIQRVHPVRFADA